ncbi:hypothetical protein, partial [Nostoc sp.]|uniref:hypothetical protein n=1 Tax=Nostoc sp. TaxID=1180 RepID=UPI002FF178CE
NTECNSAINNSLYEAVSDRPASLRVAMPEWLTALTAAMRYIPKSESFDRRGQGEKLYCVIAGSAVSVQEEI